MPSYPLTGHPTVIDNAASISAAITNTGAVPVLVLPMGQQILPGASLTVPLWADVRTRLRTAGQAGAADVTLTAGTPAVGPGPGAVTFDPTGVGSMSVNIAGGSWFTSEGLTTAATLPLTVSTPTVLYPAAPASVTVTMTAGSVSKTVGMNVVAGCAEMVRMTDYISATELPSAATVGVAAAAFAPITGSGTYASIARPGLDNAAAQRDAAYRPWVNQCTSAAVPRVVITGHSVVASSGATGGIGFVEHIQGVGTGVGNALSHWVPNVVVDKDGHNGWTTTQLLANGAGILPRASATGCVVMMCLINDYYNGIPSATTKSNLLGLIAAYRAVEAAPGPSIIIAIEWQITSPATPTEAWANYVAVAKQVAAEDAYVNVLDLGTRMGNPPGSLSLYRVDGTHPNDAGYALIAKLITQELVRQPSVQVFQPAVIIDAAQTVASSTTWNGVGSVPVADGYFGYTVDSSGAQSASVTWNWVGRAGHYSVGLFHRVGSNRGKYDVYIDGALQGSGGTFDGYAASTTNTYTVVAGITVLTDGAHTIQLVMSTKNASSSSYYGSVGKIVLTRTGV